MTEFTSTPPADPPLTLADFEAAKLGDILSTKRNARLYVLSRAFGDAAESAVAAGRTNAHSAMSLLQRVCFMHLQPLDKISPFGSVQNTADGSSSQAPQNFTNDEINVLMELAQHVAHDELRGRIADLVWIRAKRQGRTMADMAIAGYLALPMAPDTWLSQGKPRWHRALQLAISLGDRAKVNEISGQLLVAFRAAGDDLAHPALSYLDPLEVEELCRDQAESIAEQLARSAEGRMKDKRFDDTQAPLARAITWFKRAGPKLAGRLADVQFQRGLAVEAEAETRSQAIVRQTLYIDAIRHLREVGGVFREVLAVDDVIARVRHKLGGTARLVLGELKIVKSPSVDVTEFTRAAIESVKGQSPIDALVAFCGMDDIPIKSNFLTQASNIIAESPLLAMISTSTVSASGHVVATSPNGPTLPGKAAELYRLHAGVVATAAITPALDQINLEHVYTLEDFQSLAEACPIVPPGRAATFGRGLYAGYRRDLVSAMHILMPQFEHVVRMQLKGAGCLTTTHDSDGIDMEVGLSTLIERPQMVDVFGEDLKFAVKTLMCDQEGPNLRNDVAHGLADDDRMDSAHGLYTWWLVLRIVIEQWWIARYHATPPASAATPPTAAG